MRSKSPLDRLTPVQRLLVRVVRVVPFVENQMAVKSDAELALIRESSKWANLAHRLLQSYTRPGLTETEVTQRASNLVSVSDCRWASAFSTDQASR